MAPRTLTYVKKSQQFGITQSSLSQCKAIKRTIFQQQFLKWVKFDKCLHSKKKKKKSYQTSNQSKTIFGLNLNSTHLKYKHFDKTFLTLCHTRRQIYQLVWDADPWPATEFQQLKKSINFQEMTVSRGNNSEKRKKKKKRKRREKTKISKGAINVYQQN
jgi:glutaredoxin